MLSDEQFAELMDRVEKFERLELPGQPMGMHMGTLYLVSDLKRALVQQREALRKQE